jgi:hypothetical protein
MDIPVLSTAYLAPVQYYSKLARFPAVLIENEEHYSKQSYRNRCDIYSANGQQTLSIPVMKGQGPKAKITEVRIDYTENWQKLHWKSFESAYRNSPFFDFVADEIYGFYEKQIPLLFDFNLQLQQVVTELLEIDVEIKFTGRYEKQYIEPFIDYRDSIHPKKRCRQPDPLFEVSSYYQVFEEKHGFIKNLSIIDLMFNEGPGAAEYL